MTAFARTHAITDICLIVADLERASRFYVERMGFQMRRKADGFADFKGAGATLALWEAAHFETNTGIPVRRTQPGMHKVCSAIELASPASVDAAYAELTAAGVDFSAPPTDFPWNARCCYFHDPDDNLWELYAWNDGGPVGDLDSGVGFSGSDETGAS